MAIQQHTSSGRRTSFPSPYEQPAPEGAEDWRSLYPYNVLFQPERRAVEEAKFWFCDNQHWPTVLKPFDAGEPLPVRLEEVQVGRVAEVEELESGTARPGGTAGH